MVKIGLKKFLGLFKKLKERFRRYMLLVTLKAKKLLERFTIKNRQKWKRVTVEKVIKKKSDELDVKWKDYESYFNSWIDKKDIV